MEIERQKKSINDLEVGMYVCELDRSWLETPFLMQGFIIESAADIEEVAKHCQFVYIDVLKSRTRSTSVQHSVASLRPNNSEFEALKRDAKLQKPENLTFTSNPKRVSRLAELLTGRELRRYQDTMSWREEIGEARKSIFGLTQAIQGMFKDITKGKGLQVAKLKQAVNPLVNSVERNPDACIWLARLRNQDSYIYQHSVACSVWGVTFGRQLGLPPSDLKSLALGAMLLDIGKLEIPGELLFKKGALSRSEAQTLRTHVNHSLEALNKSASTNRDVWAMVAYHHERFNGKGYPNQLRGEKIPLFAQIAGIVDCYDAMTSDRPYNGAVSPSLAIRYLYHQRDKKFDGILVEEFIQAVGLYPAGTLVLLSTGEVAIVVAEGRTRRLKPRVLLLTNKEKHPLNELQTINLVDARSENGRPIEIVQSLEPNAYGIDPETIDYDPQNAQVPTAQVPNTQVPNTQAPKTMERAS